MTFPAIAFGPTLIEHEGLEVWCVPSDGQLSDARHELTRLKALAGNEYESFDELADAAEVFWDGVWAQGCAGFLQQFEPPESVEELVDAKRDFVRALRAETERAIARVASRFEIRAEDVVRHMTKGWV
jgi:hypothetical protein